MIRLQSLLIEATAEEVVNDPSYIEYFKQAEGSVKNSKGFHYVYDDQDPSYPKKFIQNAGEAKGILTIGYGHTGKDVKPGMTIDDATAIRLLKMDMLNSYKVAIAHIKKRFPNAQLSKHQIQMLMDYVFNVKGGLNEFPKFTAAVIKQDWDAAETEFERNFDSGKPLVARNALFKSKFLDTTPDLSPDKNIGKTVYPLEVNKFANVRSDAEVNSGWFNNLDATIQYPNAIGKVLGVETGEDGAVWYKVQYIKDNTKQIGYVRSDVATVSVPVDKSAIYTVVAGDSLSKIAEKQKTTVDRIKRLNKLTSDDIQVGQQLKVK